MHPIFFTGRSKNKYQLQTGSYSSFSNTNGVVLYNAPFFYEKRSIKQNPYFSSSATTFSTSFSPVCPAPFGVELDQRHGAEAGANYRYGMNGMEKDDEVKGAGNSYTSEFRQYDPRIGRWLTLDPLMVDFPHQSPYVAFDNNPIYYKDPLGASAEGPEDPKKIPAGTKSTTTSRTDETFLERKTTIVTTTAERTFNAEDYHFTTVTTTKTSIITYDKLTGKFLPMVNYSQSSTTRIHYVELTGKPFDPYMVELDGLMSTDKFKNMTPKEQEKIKLEYQHKSEEADRIDRHNAQRAEMDQTVVAWLPWYQIARGIEEVQAGNNWGWLRIGLEIVPLEVLGPVARKIAPGLIYESKYLGYSSYLFGIGRNGYQKGVLNSGLVRIGWGYSAPTRSHVLRLGLGNNPKFYPTTLVFGKPLHYHLNLLSVPAKF